MIKNNAVIASQSSDWRGNPLVEWERRGLRTENSENHGDCRARSDTDALEYHKGEKYGIF